MRCSTTRRAWQSGWSPWASSTQTYNNMAGVYQDSNRLAEAKAFFRKALAIYRATFGDLYPETGKAGFNLGLLCLQQNRRAEAKAYFQQAHAAFLASFGPDHPHVHLAAQQLASV